MPILILAAENPVLAAMLAALLLAGLGLLALAISHLMPNVHIPVIGNLRTIVAHAAASALHAVEGWLDAALSPLANFLLLPYHISRTLFDKVVHLASTIYNGLNALLHLAQHVYNLAVRYAEGVWLRAEHFAQHVYNLAVRYAEGVWLRAEHFAQHVYNLAAALVASALHTAVAFAQHVYNLAAELVARAYHDAVAFAQHVYNLAAADAATAYRDAVAFAQHVYNLAHAETAAALHTAESYAAHVAQVAAADAARVLITDVVQPVDRVWIDIRDDAAALEGILATDLPDIRALTRAIPRAIPADMAEAVGALAAVEALTMRYLRDCGIPGCKSLGSLVRDLPKLFELAEGAAFLAFLAAIVADPDGMSREVRDVVGPTVTDTIDGARHLLGV